MTTDGSSLELIYYKRDMLIIYPDFHGKTDTFTTNSSHSGFPMHSSGSQAFLILPSTKGSLHTALKFYYKKKPHSFNIGWHSQYI